MKYVVWTVCILSLIVFSESIVVGRLPGFFVLSK
jgi:hypothetical protein